MTDTGNGWAPHDFVQYLRDWIGDHLGVTPQRKAEIYLEASASPTVLNGGYWLEVFFSAGIATFGLVLNSPAVIIGAMLISPLMGPILSNGLALAAGDVILGLRSVVNLLLSSLLAVGLAAILVWILPFKEITPEISSRIQPNTLDLAVALFSGAVGSLSLCRRATGIVTSIPGVAIAVALMPPLSVIGFGIGLATGGHDPEGWRIARGGGLLFLTNLVAITFAAMLVFLLLHIDIRQVRTSARSWAEKDPESVFVGRLLQKIPVLRRLKAFESLPVRVVLTVAAIIILAIPLNESFMQLRREITRKHNENELLSVAARMCQEKVPGAGGGPRCSAGPLSISSQDGQAVIGLRVFTTQPFSATEREQLVQAASTTLGRPPKEISLQMVEIPTTSGELAGAIKEAKPAAPLTVAQLQADLLASLRSSLDTVDFPPPAQLIDFHANIGELEPFRVDLVYLNDHVLGEDSQALIISAVRSRLNFPQALVDFEHVPSVLGPVDFPAGRRRLTTKETTVLDSAGEALQRNLALKLLIEEERTRRESSRVADARQSEVLGYLTDKWQVDPARIRTRLTGDQGKAARVVLKLVRELPPLEASTE